MPLSEEVGPRARLLTCYPHANLSISLGKTHSVFQDFFVLRVSRVGLLGQLRWDGDLFATMVEELWRINGQLAWAWYVCDPRLAVLFIDYSHSCKVLL